VEKLIKFLLWGVLAAGLSGCGFHLQGRADYGEELEAIYLEVPDDATPLARELSRSLEISALNVVDDAAAATAVLQILSDDTGRSVESVDAQNRPREYLVFYRATYRVLSGGKVLLDNQRVIRTRIYTYDELEVLAKAHEEDMLREALAREIAGVITRRLANIEAPTT
jgi:outer membrane lipopolysaccharide assembly protein LptE/RlpB